MIKFERIENIATRSAISKTKITEVHAGCHQYKILKIWPHHLRHKSNKSINNKFS